MYSNVLVPIAFDSDDKTKAAIDVARGLAGTSGRITLLHVMEKLPNFAVNYIPADYMAQSRGAVQSELDSLAGDLPNAKGVLIEGHSGRSILDWAEKHPTDCIVIASHRPGMQDLLLGSTAAKVVRHATCAVHVLR